MIIISTLIGLIALLIALSAIYNAYLLRGGKLAISEVLIAIAMVVLMLSQLLGPFIPDLSLVGDVTVGSLFFIGGFVILLAASFKLRASIK